MRSLLLNAGAHVGTAVGLTLALLITAPAGAQDTPATAPPAADTTPAWPPPDSRHPRFGPDRERRSLGERRRHHQLRHPAADAALAGGHRWHPANLRTTAGIAALRPLQPDRRRPGAAGAAARGKEQKANIIATDSVIDDVVADMAKDSHMTSEQFIPRPFSRAFADTLRSQLKAQESFGVDPRPLRLAPAHRRRPDQGVSVARRPRPTFPSTSCPRSTSISTRPVIAAQANDEATQLIGLCTRGFLFRRMSRGSSPTPRRQANGGDGHRGWSSAAS